MTGEEALKPFVVQITGPLIRIIGDRFPSQVGDDRARGPQGGGGGEGKENDTRCCRGVAEVARGRFATAVCYDCLPACMRRAVQVAAQHCDTGSSTAGAQLYTPLPLS